MMNAEVNQDGEQDLPRAEPVELTAEGFQRQSQEFQSFDQEDLAQQEGEAKKEDEGVASKTVHDENAGVVTQATELEPKLAKTLKTVKQIKLVQLGSPRLKGVVYSSIDAGERAKEPSGERKRALLKIVRAPKGRLATETAEKDADDASENLATRQDNISSNRCSMAGSELSLLPMHARLSAEDRKVIMQKAKLYKMMQNQNNQPQNDVLEDKDIKLNNSSPNELLLKDLKAQVKNFKNNMQQQSTAVKPNVVQINIAETVEQDDEAMKETVTVGASTMTWEADGSTQKRIMSQASPVKGMDQGQDLLHVAANSSSPSQDQSQAMYKIKRQSQPKQGGTGSGTTQQQPTSSSSSSGGSQNGNMVSHGTVQSQNLQQQTARSHIRRGSQSPKNRVSQIVEMEPRISAIRSRQEANESNKNEEMAPAESKLEDMEPAKELSPTSETQARQILGQTQAQQVDLGIEQQHIAESRMKTLPQQLPCSITEATQNSNTDHQASSSFKKVTETNIFHSYFQEMNDKAHEAMSRSQPEPERALEFLKKAEGFLQKIDQAQKSFEEQRIQAQTILRTEGCEDRSKELSFLDGIIDKKDKMGAKVNRLEEASVQASRMSDPDGCLIEPNRGLSNDLDSRNGVLTIYRTGRHTPGEPREGVSDSSQPNDHPKLLSYRDNGGRPYAVSYTLEQLSQVDVDPTFKVVLYYNMACCYQRLQLFDECAEYLENSMQALQERIKRLEDQEQSLLFFEHQQQATKPTHLASSRNSTRDGGYLNLRYDTWGNVKQTGLNELIELPGRLQENALGPMTPGGKLQSIQTLLSGKGFKPSRQRSRVGGRTALGGARSRQQNEHYATQYSESNTAVRSVHDQAMINLDKASVARSIQRQGTDDERSFSNAREQQQQNEKYEKILAQKMQSLRYQCKLYLQICAIMSQLNKHRDALIFGEKSSAACFQLIKDAQLLCKRQMNQIRRQGGNQLIHDDKDESEAQAARETGETNAYGEMAGRQDGNDGEDWYSAQQSEPKQAHGLGRSLQKKGKNSKRLRSSSNYTSAKKDAESSPTRGVKRGEYARSKRSVHKESNQKQADARLSYQRNESPGTKRSVSSRSDEQLQGPTNLQIQGLELLRSDGFRSNNPTPLREKQQMANRVQEQRIQSRGYDERSNSLAGSNSNQSVNSYQSNTSVARIKIRRAFDLKSTTSSKESRASKKSRSKFHRRDNSATSELSQESLKRVHTFALKTPKEQEADGGEHEDNKPKEQLQAKSRAKVYYVEEHVKVLSEVIAQADPILSELASQIYQFQKLTSKKISAKQRDIDLYERYGKDDFMTEREKLNISFHNLQEIEAMQQIKQFKISVRNNLGLKQQDDWIYNLNIGNVMHLSLMGIDELAPISPLDQEGSKTGAEDTLGEKDKVETSHELCKDAMLEKIVLISVGYFCIATEMRFLTQRQKGASQSATSSKKDSEMYHAKAVHISSLFLPKECPLVQHIAQSYQKNYLKDKPNEFNLEQFLEGLGIKLQHSEDHSGSSFENNDFDEGLQDEKINMIRESVQAQAPDKQPAKKVKIKVKDSIAAKRGSMKPISSISAKRMTTITGLHSPKGGLMAQLTANQGVLTGRKATVPVVGLDLNAGTGSERRTSASKPRESRSSSRGLLASYLSKKSKLK